MSTHFPLQGICPRGVLAIKTCLKCYKTESEVGFAFDRKVCRICRNAAVREIYARDPLYSKRNNLKSKYGLTLDQYYVMLMDQSNCCKICHTHKSKLKTVLCVDHDHKTGKIRGLICHTCNRGIGLFKDNANMLRKAANYIEEVSNGR